MRKLRIALAVVAAGALAFLLALVAPVRTQSPYAVSFVVMPGEGLDEIAGSLQGLGVIRERRAFMFLAVVSGRSTSLKAGPYRAASDEWAWTILQRIAHGDVQDTSVTVPEGLWTAEVVLIGLPLNMDDTEGPAAARARALGAARESHGFAVRFQDERLTSDDARRWLRERGETRPASGRVDQVAALLLLQEFLMEAGRSGRA